MNKQIKRISNAILALLLVTMGVSMQAQADVMAEPTTPKMQADAPKMSDQDRKAKVYEQLNLTDDQKVQVDALLKTQRDEMQILRGSDIDRREKREQIKGMRSKHQDQMSSILSKDQMVKYSELVSKRTDKLKGKRKAARLDR